MSSLRRIKALEEAEVEAHERGPERAGPGDVQDLSGRISGDLSEPIFFHSRGQTRSRRLLTDTRLNLATCLRGPCWNRCATFALVVSSARTMLISPSRRCRTCSFAYSCPLSRTAMIVKRQSFTATNHARTPTAFTPASLHFFDPFQLRLARLSKPVGGADRGSNKAEINLTCLAIATREAQDAAACSGSSCDCDNVVLGVGDPRTSGYRLLSGGADGLPAASQLVSARLGIDGALSLRHLYLWIFLLSSGLLRLSGSLPVSASVNSYRTAGPSPAISASRVVVVMKVSSLPLSESFRCRLERKSLPTLIRPRCRSGSPARRRTVLGVLPISSLVGRQRRDSGSVIGFAIKVPTDRSHR